MPVESGFKLGESYIEGNLAHPHSSWLGLPFRRHTEVLIPRFPRSRTFCENHPLAQLMDSLRAIARVFLAPFMIHELFPSLTETAFGSHPCRVVSVTYDRTSCFHGGNTGSNPVGDAKLSQ